MRNSQQKMLEGNHPVFLKWTHADVTFIYCRNSLEGAAVHSLTVSEMFRHISVCGTKSRFSGLVCLSREGLHATPVAFICTHAGRTVLQSGLKWAHRRISGYCAGVLLGRLWIHLDFISELFWFPGVDNPGPYPPKRDRGRENDVISSLKSYSCS